MEKRSLVKIVGINGRFTHSCLAIFYLREELARRCPWLQLELHQLTINDNHFETVLRLAEDSPQAVLFSTAIWNSRFVERLIPDLRQVLPDTDFIVGGPQAKIVGRNLAAKVVCTVVDGEIEALPEHFFTELAAKRLASSYQGSLLQMAAPNFLFPYRDEDFAGPLANRHIYYESSKGCPFRCAYCLSSVETGVYNKPLDQVEEELRRILRHQPKIVRFIDRTFNALPDRALAIWRFLRREGGMTRFHFEMAPDRFTEEMFAFLEEVPPGLFQFEIGIQSTCGEVLEAIHRGADGQRIAAHIHRLSELDTIHLHLDLILGLPYETMARFAQSFRDVFALGGHYIQMGLLKVLPGTEVARRALEYGYIWTNEPPYSLLASRWLAHEELRWLYWFSELVEKFFNNRCFTSLWRYLRRRGEDIFLFFKELLMLCQREDFFSYAATHELMCEKILTLCTARDDFPLIAGLLRFDWLRCDHRFLPPCLHAGMVEEPKETRERLYSRLPGELAPLYSPQERNRFFRKSFFLRIPRLTAAELGETEENEGGILCFLPEKRGGVHGYNAVVFLQETSESGICISELPD